MFDDDVQSCFLCLLFFSFFPFSKLLGDNLAVPVGKRPPARRAARMTRQPPSQAAVAVAVAAGEAEDSAGFLFDKAAAALALPPLLLLSVMLVLLQRRVVVAGALALALGSREAALFSGVLVAFDIFVLVLLESSLGTATNTAGEARLLR